MKHTPASSSNIKSIGYDPETQQMEVAFRNGSKATYNNVPPETHQAFARAPSVGKHYHANIKGKFA